MILSKDQKIQFVDQGYIILKKFIPSNLVKTLYQEVEKATFRAQHENYGLLRKDKRFDYKSELSPAIVDIFDKYISPLGIELLEDGNKYVDGQFSVMQAGRPASVGWHIDGTWIATDKNSFEGIPFFKLLVGVYLTDLRKPETGNLMISPGGHKKVANFFMQNGPELCEKPSEAFSKLYKQSIPEFESVLAEPGDVILAHALLPHTVSANNGSDRPVIYFRLGDYKKSGYPALSDLWLEWPEWYKNL